MNPVNAKPYELPADATWLITGCSSGIGRAISELVASKPNQRLVATARNPSDLAYLPDSNPNILKLALDVTSATSVNEAFATASKYFGDSFHLDIVINNAGYSLSGDTESATEDEAHLEVETLFFGTARVTMKAVEVMRQHKEHRGGVIYQISSLAGLCSFPGNAYYHAGKYALEGWTESVAREMHPDWNINFCIIEPSGVKTNFEGHSKAHTAPHPAYSAPDMPARILEKWVNMGIKSGVGMLDPNGIAETIYQIASRGEKVPLRLPLGPTAWKLIRQKYEGFLGELDAVKDISFMGKDT
ncbi:putative retinol dehydrogenase 8 protein [Botrytis fragariae]|uniref:Putative retinol dehydrogenase 8 protein n=1 Tax=Botrytis fragariae TaxID=1964551 RepID=A0A8H6ATG6_9HELO|nr:putative retinol dehydrogenase 8 protein [Botrytis fragariae]KAF5873488.1 putative retinol dehydrogenase 8 protein [Botrytis fragariae]